MSKTQVPCLLIEVFLCFDSEAQCCTDPESQWGGGRSQIRLQRGAPASKALLQFGAADILEPVGQQNGESTEMYQAQNTLGVIYGSSFSSSTERPDSSTGSDH